METIDSALLARLPLHQIKVVTFYKRDQLTTDLICCDVQIGEQTWFFHEEARGWDLLIRHLAQLPGFRADWYAAVSQPPFSPCITVAFRRD